MAEPLLHFAVPFAIFRAFGINRRQAFLLSLFALLPDIDILFQVHRSFTHSIIFVMAIAVPLILFFKRRGRGLFALLATIAVATHLFLDLFCGFTPILWPLLNEQIALTANFTVNFSSSPTFNLDLSCTTHPADFAEPMNFEGTIFSGEGVAVSALLFFSTLFLPARRGLKK